MSTFTENYNLIKPGEEDYYDIQDMNENMDKLDGLLAENERAMQQVDAKLGQPTDGAEETIFGHLNRLEAAAGTATQAVKSIQRITFSVPNNSTSTVLPLEHGVNLERTFVIFEPPYGYPEVSLSYELGSETLTVYYPRYSYAPGYLLGFWIIECN